MRASACGGRDGPYGLRGSTCGSMDGPNGLRTSAGGGKYFVLVLSLLAGVGGGFVLEGDFPLGVAFGDLVGSIRGMVREETLKFPVFPIFTFGKRGSLGSRMCVFRR